LNLTEPAIRREFIKHIGNEFEGVIASDIADGNAKAQKIDREMGSEYARRRLRRIRYEGAHRRCACAPTGGSCLSLHVKVPWDKLSDFVRGVIMPLRNDGAALEVEVYIQAWSESGGIKEATLKGKVEETLNQIRAELIQKSYD